MIDYERERERERARPTDRCNIAQHPHQRGNTEIEVSQIIAA
jgi:hypothetical protein